MIEITKKMLINFLSFKERVSTLPQQSKRPMLFLEKVEPLTRNNKLCSGYINKMMLILQHQFPEIGGLNSVMLGQHINFPQATGKKILQIVHDRLDHWVLVAKGFSEPELVLVYQLKNS